ncbi:MEIOTIC F-BOX protein MOF-like [Panicum virgatum]|uniref:MEIOTIC F-BOX protein MOF-like n=1 Tax=Panicum virgatum TaxID=38727 RepID=UPI0019D5FEEB|nr:MEIOTIC F-BOX protein MOF-like [Panicum virgatum]
MDFEGTDGSYTVSWEKMKDFTTNLLMLHNAQLLDAIRLRTFRHKFQIPFFGSAFCRLKTLKLDGVSLDHCFTERLNSGCPVLEDLVLDSCRNEFDAIQSDTLKNLVEDCSGNVADGLVIRAPCLASLSLRFPYSYYRNGLSLEAGNSLVTASISVDSDGSSQSYQTIILGSLWNVTSVDLKGFSAMAFLDNEFDKFPIFDNLRTLSLSWCFLSEHDVHKFKALGRFLQNSPNLEKLTLQDFWVGVPNIFSLSTILL